MNPLHFAYKKIRGRELPTSTPLPLLSAVAFEKSLDALRGAARSRTYGDCGRLHMRGRRCKVRYPRQLAIGSGVIFGSDVVVESYSVRGVQLGDRVTVARGAAILASGVIREPGVGVSIGPDTAIGAMNVIWGQGGVAIGRDCLLGPNVVIVSENHTFDDTRTPIRMQPPDRHSVSIGDDCWLGAGVKVTAGAVIGHGSVIGANSVVIGTIPPNSVAVGSPARVIRTRGGISVHEG